MALSRTLEKGDLFLVYLCEFPVGKLLVELGDPSFYDV
jgi:hypothetical protein